MLTGLQVGRGIAALLVVLHHATLGSEQFYGTPFNRFFEFGYIGVDFFFVLSGFIIYYIHHNDPVGTKSWIKYIKKRLIRVFTPYIIISLVLLVAYKYLGIANRDVNDISVISSLLLVPTNGSPALTVAWTLIHEMIFYLLFSSYFVSRRLFFLIACGWALLIIGIGLSGQETSRFSNYFIGFHNLEFLLGIIVARLTITKVAKQESAPVFLLGGMAMLFLFIANANYPAFHLSGNVEIVYLAICFSCIVLGMVLSDIRYQFSYPKILVYLGASSYSIYLVHNPAISVLNRLLTGNAWKTPEVSFVIISVMATLCGVLFYQFYERHALNTARRIFA